MITFKELVNRWELRPIQNCPGRFIIHSASAELTPGELLGCEAAVQTFNESSARDTVLVARLEGGGLISYRGADGKYLHTLNTNEGFERKLLDLGIEI